MYNGNGRITDSEWDDILREDTNLDEYLEDRKYSETEKYYSRTHRTSMDQIHAAVKDYYCTRDWN